MNILPFGARLTHRDYTKSRVDADWHSNANRVGVVLPYDRHIEELRGHRLSDIHDRVLSSKADITIVRRRLDDE